MFIEKARLKHGDKYQYDLVKFERLSDKIKIICPKHGIFEVRASNHLLGVGCAQCGFERNADAKRGNVNTFIEKARAAHGDVYDYSKVIYKNADTKVEIVCPKHGSFWQSPDKHIRGKGCKACGIIARANKRRGRRINTAQPVALRASNFVKKAQLVHGKTYDYSKVVYESSQKNVEIVCPKHGSFWQSPNNHVSGKGCNRCTASKIESDYAEIYPQFERTRRDLIPPYEIDLYCAEKRLGVEIDGIHWHSSQFKPDNYHAHKTALAEAQGITLLHFWDNEDRELVKSMIDAKLGLSKRIFGRKCKIVEVSADEARKFTKYNHLQGAVNASVRYGLTLGGELVALMTFAKPRYSKTADWELMRYCSQRGTVVVGGASRLFKHFLKNHSGSVISYANRRFSKGNLYAKLGFKLGKITAPNYWYVKDGVIRYSRNQCQKHKLKDLLGEAFNPELSERQNMLNAGYHRIYDCGNYVYLFER